MIGKPANIFPSFLIPKTADFQSTNDVQDRVRITLTDDAGLEQVVHDSVTEEKAFYRMTLTPTSVFRPGKYRFKAVLDRTHGISAGLQNFFKKMTGQDQANDLPLIDSYFDWGMTAVNFDSSSYKNGADAHISTAVITNDGSPLCIDTLTGSFVNGVAKTLSPFCSGSGETMTLSAPSSGTSATLIMDASDTDVSRVIKQIITIENNPMITIERESVTRTTPGRTEHMRIHSQAAQSITGTMTEQVPTGITVTNIQPAPTNVIQNIDGTFITWSGLWQSDAGRDFSYDYTTPDTAPTFALFGPLKMRGQMDQTAMLSSSSSSSETSSLMSAENSSVSSNVSEVSSQDASTTSDSSASSESSESSSQGGPLGFLGNFLASLIVDDQRNVSFDEDHQWQLLSVEGTADFSPVERARRLTLERAQGAYEADASPTFKLVDTQLSGSDARLLDVDHHLRSDIAYQEILQSVVRTSDVAQTGSTINAIDAKDKVVTDLAVEASKNDGAIAGDTNIQPTQVLSLQLTGPNGQIVHPPFHFAVGSVDLVLDPIQSFVPGLYTLEVTVTNPITGESQVLTQQFAWGVLALNADKDIYTQGDTAHIDFGTLDDKGEIVCDADLKLTVVTPDTTTQVYSTTSTSTGTTIIRTGTCGIKQAGFINPDFYTRVPLTQSGAYHLTLQGTIKGRSRSITSVLLVQNNAPFVISRSGATRLWPFANSPMNIDVRFNTDVAGSVIETVPSGFAIISSEPSGTVTKDTDGTSHIQWDGDWKAGDTAHFHYVYKAPEISPYFYLMGPVEIQSDQPFLGSHLTSSGQTIDQ